MIHGTQYMKGKWNMKLIKKSDLVKYNVVQDYPKEGVNFIDFTPTIRDASAFSDMVATLIFNSTLDYDYIIAPEARGFVWGAAFAWQTRKPLLIARKPGKIPPVLVGASVTYDTEYSTDTLELEKVDLTGKKVCYVDDVFATGGTYKACKELVKQLGGTLKEGTVLYNVGLVDNDEVETVFQAGELI